ncbi:sensor histidine kinase [Nakamurella multipartita]|uniref:histidine kinase n=1 Tax=Nakamurella multipartita (strain ATCC 700099 / DSM 44233 / CIP 104796 / JCM 9543 / NBRC 105858 / Y-104) TaxID=479431 RepID=C8X7N0_NAKMY|nr:sensor histidine kinase [Nakamurella multipartita]ACV78983.1 histidine kinase [Nakamurella multipartita DSM 44233]
MTLTRQDLSPVRDGRRRRPASRGWSLYLQVVAVNTAIMLAAALLLVLSPITVSFPVAAEQGVFLGVGVIVIAIANAALLRLSFHGLAGLVRRMENLDLLRTGEPLPVRGGLETRALIAGYNTMLDRLETERRTSTRRSVSSLEGERRRIGQELHDEIGQRLTGILLQLRGLRDGLPEQARPQLHQIQSEVRATLDEVGALAWQLRPGILDDLGLRRALEALCDTLRAHATARFVLHLPARTPSLPSEVELAFYRVAQEALTNAVRHAHASTISVSLSARGRRVALDIVDDGTGLADGTEEGAGIRGMRERALLIGARIAVRSLPTHGVQVTLTLDLPGSDGRS